MKLSEVIKKYGDFEITDEMIKTIEPEFKPKVGETYWAVIGGSTYPFTWEDNKTDLFSFNKHNVYRTKEAAQFALDIYNFCKERSFTPNWKDETVPKYYLYLDCEDNAVYSDCDEYLNEFHPFYYPTHDAVEEVLHKYTFDELAEYYGRV